MDEHPSQSSVWTPQRLTELATSYWQSAALMAGVELGVFDALANDALSAQTLAEKLSTAPSQTAALLDALVSLGLVTKSGDQYSIEASAAKWLSRSSPTSLADALMFNGAMYGLWGKLRECVQAGVPVVPPTQHFGNDPMKTRAFVHAMHSRGLALLPAVVPHLDIPLGASVLDIGAGPGTLDRLLLDRDPSLTLSLQDLPGIVAQARELWKDQPRKSAVRFIEGDYRQVLPREQFDVVLYSGALHQHPVDQARALFKRLADVVRPGGKLIVIDLMIGDDGGSSFANLFQLNMLLINPQARVYAVSDVRQMLGDAGFIDSNAVEVPGSIYHVVSAKRRT